MQIGEIASRAVPVLIVILIVIAIWAIVELALTLRKARTTLDATNDTVTKVDPLLEHATLTVDALNLELMRIDQIIEDVEQVTDAATSAAESVSQMSAAPMEIAAGIADRLRTGAKSRNRAKAVQSARSQTVLAQGAQGNTAVQLESSKHAVAEAASRENEISAASSSKGVTVIEPANTQDLDQAAPSKEE